VSILSTFAIPGYFRNEVTGRGYATFGDRSVEFGPYDDPHSAAAYDKTLASWLANGRRLPTPDDQAVVTPGQQRISFARFREEVLSLYAPQFRSAASLRGMTHALRCMEEAGVCSTVDLTVSMLVILVTKRPPANSPNSTRTVLRYVQAACSFAEKMGYVRISPFKIRSIGSLVRATPARGKKHASRDEIRRVLDLMREQAEVDGWRGWRAKRVYALTSTLAYTGIRAGEAYFLQVCDVDLERGVLWIVSRACHRTKTVAAAAPIPMPPPLIPILADWLKYYRMMRPPGCCAFDEACPWVFPNLRRSAKAPWAEGSMGTKPRERMQTVGAQAGVVGFGPLMLRHSFATHLLHWGAGSGIVKRILRHTSERTAQQWYTHDDLPNLKAAVANVEF
jgi:integrase